MISLDDKEGLRNLLRLMIAGFTIAMVFVFGYNFWQQESYPQPTSREEIKGEIIALSAYQSVVNIELDDNSKFMIVDSRNYDLEPYTIQAFLRIGDYLIKEPHSDTLTVIRDDKFYTFVIGKDLNVDLRKSP